MSKKSNVAEQEVIIDADAELNALPTTSAKIRYLLGKGLSRGAVAKKLTEVLGKTIRYQHVRNVEITPIKKQKA